MLPGDDNRAGLRFSIYTDGVADPPPGTINGDANGMPPLHRDMSRRAWTRAFTDAYEELCDRVDAGEPLPFDDDAAEDPGEFFAVLSEAFFMTPHVVEEIYPAVYAQLSSFYRQDPVRRLANIGSS